MPANLVEGQDAEDVAAYVASVAGVPGIEAPEFIASEFFATQLRRLPRAERRRDDGQHRPEPRRRAPRADRGRRSPPRSANPQEIISAGFPAGVMPANYGDTLQPDQLAALVDYLLQSIGGQPAGAGAPGSGTPSKGN